MRMKKIFLRILAIVFLGIGFAAVPGLFSDMGYVAQARQDYYLGYDDYNGTDVYIDIDSVSRVYAGNTFAFRQSKATVHCTDDSTWTQYAIYKYSTGEYYSSNGHGVHPATGWQYNFAVMCDQIAW